MSGIFPWRFVLAVLFCLFALTAGTGCGRSSPPRSFPPKKNAEAIEQELIERVRSNYDAVEFPGSQLNATSFTYELQDFFEANKGRVILFKGYLDDIERTGDVIIVECSCALGRNMVIDKTAVRFRLTATSAQAMQLLNAPRGDPMLRSIRYILGPGRLFVAKIDGLRKIRHYEFSGTAQGEEAEIDPEISIRFVGSGTLVESVRSAKDENLGASVEPP